MPDLPDNPVIGLVDFPPNFYDGEVFDGADVFGQGSVDSWVSAGRVAVIVEGLTPKSPTTIELGGRDVLFASKAQAEAAQERYPAIDTDPVEAVVDPDTTVVAEAEAVQSGVEEHPSEAEPASKRSRTTKKK